MILTGPEITRQIEDGRIGITPFDPARVQPCSYDVTLGEVMIQPAATRFIDCKRPPEELVDVSSYVGEKGVFLRPGFLYIATTREVIRVPDDLCARVEGKSSLGRLGVSIHQTAGFIDPGFHGEITLEITVVYGTTVYPGMPIGQLCFMQTAGAVQPYRGKYQGQKGPTASRYYLNFVESA